MGQLIVGLTVCVCVRAQYGLEGTITMRERGGGCLHTDLCSLDFVACAAAPSCEVWENLAFLTFHTRLHLTPPLLGYDRGWRTRDEQSRHIFVLLMGMTTVVTVYPNKTIWPKGDM